MGMRCLHVSPNLESVSGSSGDVRFGSKADMCSALADVRFVPIADIHYLIRSLRRHAAIAPVAIQPRGLWQSSN